MNDPSFFNVALDTHLRAENEHDVEAIVRTFSDRSEVVWGGKPYRGLEAIRKLHDGMGFGDAGAFSDLEVVERNRHQHGSTIIVEQLLRGRHTGIWEGVPATQKAFEVSVCTVYEFDESGILISERPHLDRWVIWKQIHRD